MSCLCGVSNNVCVARGAYRGMNDVACCVSVQHCESVCASLQAVDADKDIAEYVSRAATGTDRPGPLQLVALTNTASSLSYSSAGFS